MSRKKRRDKGMTEPDVCFNHNGEITHAVPRKSGISRLNPSPTIPLSFSIFPRVPIQSTLTRRHIPAVIAAWSDEFHGGFAMITRN